MLILDRPVVTGGLLPDQDICARHAAAVPGSANRIYCVHLSNEQLIFMWTGSNFQAVKLRTPTIVCSFFQIVTVNERVVIAACSRDTLLIYEVCITATAPAPTLDVVERYAYTFHRTLTALNAHRHILCLALGEDIYVYVLDNALQIDPARFLCIEYHADDVYLLQFQENNPNCIMSLSQNTVNLVDLSSWPNGGLLDPLNADDIIDNAVVDDMIAFTVSYPFAVDRVRFDERHILFQVGQDGIVIAETYDGAILFQSYALGPRIKNFNVIVGVSFVDRRPALFCSKWNGQAAVFLLCNGAPSDEHANAKDDAFRFKREIVFNHEAAPGSSQRKAAKNPSGERPVTEPSSAELDCPEAVCAMILSGDVAILFTMKGDVVVFPSLIPETFVGHSDNPSHNDT